MSDDRTIGPRPRIKRRKLPGMNLIGMNLAGPK
jgi:hypothetical protein